MNFTANKKLPEVELEKMLKEAEYQCERWKEDCGKAEREAAEARKENQELMEKLKDLQHQHEIHVEALKKYYGDKLSEIAAQFGKEGRKNMDSLSDKDLKGIFARIQDTTAKIEKLLLIDKVETIKEAAIKVETPENVETKLDKLESPVKELLHVVDKEFTSSPTINLEISNELEKDCWQKDLLKMINSI